MKHSFIVLFLSLSHVVFGMEVGQFLDMPDLTPQFSQKNSRSLDRKRMRLAAVPAINPARAVRIDRSIDCKELSIRDRRGVCFNYAMMKTFKAYGINEQFRIVGCEDWQKQLYCFKNVTRHKKGDLAVYFDIDDSGYVQIKHYGIVADPCRRRIKDKWGVIKGIYEHDMFCLPYGYGNHVVVLRIKENFRSTGQAQSLLIKRIKEMERDLWTLHALRHNEKLLLKIAAKPSDDVKNDLSDIVALVEQSTAVRVDVKDRHGMTPLMHAVSNNNYEVARLFLAYGARKACKNDNGETAFTIVRKNRNEEIQQLLIQ